MAASVMVCTKLSTRSLPRFCIAFSTFSYGCPTSLFSDSNIQDLQRHLQNPDSVPSASWKRLAALTHDPMIEQVSKRLASERSLPKTLTLAMKDPRPCMILSIDNHDVSGAHTIVNVNDAFTRLSGYAREDAVNQSMESLLNGPETEREAAEAMIEATQMGRAIMQGVITHYARNGRKFHDFMRLGTILSGDGSTLYVLCVLYEVAGVRDKASLAEYSAW